MSSQTRIAACAVALMLGLGVHAVGAQTATATPPADPNHRSSNMGPPSGNSGAANNGIGTAGSLNSNAGTASSTVSGVNGGTTPFGAGGASGAGGTMESDPVQGGDKPPQ